MSIEGLRPTSFTSTSSAILFTAIPTTVVTLIAWKWFKYNSKTSSKESKSFPIDYPHPEFPFAIRMIAKLPDFIRRPMLIQGNKPNPPLDGVDVGIGGGGGGGSSSYNPYEYKELVPNKVWRIRYRFVQDPKMNEALSLFGIDIKDRKILDTIDDPNLRQRLENDMDNADALDKKNQSCCPKDDIKQHARNAIDAGFVDSQDMLVTRLIAGSNNNDGNDDNSNGLLIYNPCRMHPPVIDYLNSLGVVKYIVSGSSSHTNQIPQASKVFPNAKIICAKAAELKCRAAGLVDAEYCIYADHGSDNSSGSGGGGYHSIVTELDQKYGINMFHVVGDVQTQSLVVVAYGHLFDTDLATYGNGQRWINIDQNDWENANNTPPPASTTTTHGAYRFYYAVLNSGTIKGYLPNFRLMAMDPLSSFSKLMLDEPTELSCKEMATSLRSLLKLDFDFVNNVHSRRKESVPAQEFREYICNAWNWLDGNGLA